MAYCSDYIHPFCIKKTIYVTIQLCNNRRITKCYDIQCVREIIRLTTVEFRFHGSGQWNILNIFIKWVNLIGKKVSSGKVGRSYSVIHTAQSKTIFVATHN